MKTYQMGEIEAQIKAHQFAAVAFLEIAESEILKFDFRIVTGNTEYFLSSPVTEVRALDIARKYFYDMSAYHTKQKLRWELIKSGADPDAIISSIKKS